jgi:subtilisin family serine protease
MTGTMRTPEYDAESLSFCGVLSRELRKLLDRASSHAEGAPKPGLRGRPLHIEPLELRCLLTTTAAAAVNWFADVSDTTTHAGAAVWITDTTSAVVTDTITSQSNASNVYDWIVQFNTSSLTNIHSVAETATLLAGDAVQFEVLSGLGLEGMVLVRSCGASYETVTSRLAHDADVAAFEQDATRAADTAAANDPLQSQQWALSKIHASQAWNISTGSSKVVVAVIDTGIDYDNTDLAANMWVNPNAGNDGFGYDLHGYDFANNDSDPTDDNGHGTHVAGIIGAVGNNGVGVIGVNWSVSLMSVKFLNADGSGSLSNAIRAINYVTMMRTVYDVDVRVINASWGSTTFSAAMNTAIQATGNAGILFVTAAGNSAANNDATGQYPANYAATNILSVAASDKKDNLASFSNYGATTVDVAAPGVTIYSTLLDDTYGAYSGTSMAAPYVSAIAALCWAVNADATIDEVREAIIDGCDTTAGLAGKVASNGRVDAYKTLEIIVSQMDAGPSINAIAASSSDVYVGSSITLSAAGIATTTGTITSVSFYRDANGNGTYDSGDALVGSTGTVANGTASITLDTSNYAAGVCRFLAIATDSKGRTAVSSAATLTLWKNDHGNTAATATALGINSSQTGIIELAGGVDWHQFQAVAGKTYVFTTQLGTLAGTSLSLYAADGKTQLATSASNNGSRITWTAPTSGTYYLVVAATGSSATGSYTLAANVQNAAPVLTTIADQMMAATQGTLKIALAASKASANSPVFSAKLLKYDPLAQQAYSLDQQYGFSQAGSSYSANLHGLQEKYLVGADNTLYCILPTGCLYRWGGSLAKSTLIATLSPAYYATPALLCNAPSPTLIAMTGSSVTASVIGNTLTINRLASYTGDFYVQVTVSDGVNTSAQVFHVTIEAATTAKANASSSNAASATARAVTTASTASSTTAATTSPTSPATTSVAASASSPHAAVASSSAVASPVAAVETGPLPTAIASLSASWTLSDADAFGGLSSIVGLENDSSVPAADLGDTAGIVNEETVGVGLLGGVLTQESSESATQHQDAAIAPYNRLPVAIPRAPTASLKSRTDETDWPQACWNDIAQLRSEVAELLRRCQSTEYNAVDGYYADLAENNET